MSSPEQLPGWQTLREHLRAVGNTPMSDLFAADKNRFEQFSRRFEDILVDFSKNRVDSRTFELLLELARQAEVPAWIERMFTGAPINHTEQRAALHVALRHPGEQPFPGADNDLGAKVRQVHEQMRQFVDKVRSGAWQGYSGKRIHNVINIGIGGSDLGPRLVCQALQPYGDPMLKMHFISSVDSAHVHPILTACDPQTTLFIIASKTFTTQETMRNAATARDWLLSAMGHEAAIAKHFVAVSTNAKAVKAFGIDTANMFALWDWVGGRYSLWSAIGLPGAIYLGMECFTQLLQGAHAMDEHFRHTPLADNLPVILALIGIWNNNFLAADGHLVLVYDNYLRALPSYIQQLDMESNGKSIDRDGKPVDYKTGPTIWGGPGNNGQHAYFQLLHQGTRLLSADFLAPVETADPIDDHQHILLAHLLAQSEALMNGRTEAQARAELKARKLKGKALEAMLPYWIFPGNRPSNTILYRRLTPRTLGSLLALYEHKIFVQGVIWNINSFDQWGVELGKQLADDLLALLKSKRRAGKHDSSTRGLLAYCREKRQ